MVVREDYAGAWADAEDIGKAILALIRIDDRPLARVGRETPAGRNLDGGTIRVERIAGAPNLDETADFPLLELAMFGVDYAQAQAIRDAVWVAMKAAEGELIVVGAQSAVVDFARKESGPIRPPWSVETSTRRVIENWRLSWPPYGI